MSGKRAKGWNRSIAGGQNGWDPALRGKGNGLGKDRYRFITRDELTAPARLKLGNNLRGGMGEPVAPAGPPRLRLAV